MAGRSSQVGGNSQRPSQESTKPVYTGYKNMAFKDGKVYAELFGKNAEDIAGNFCIERGREGVSITSLRRIFDEAKRFQQVLTDDNFAEHLPYIKMIKSKTAYTVARQIKQKGSLATQYNSLREFISWGLDQVVNKKTYDIFISLFEAVYGYYYDLAPSK